MSTLSIVIPAFNEEDRLGSTLQSLTDAWSQKRMEDIELREVIVADDGSTDSTVRVAENFGASLPVRVIRLLKNTGKGAAVRAGIREAKAQFVLFYDADAAAPITEVTKLFHALQEASADIAIGSRVLGRGEGLVTMRWHRRLIGRVYHALCRALVPGIHDTACGCKLFKCEVAKKLFALQTIDRFAFDVEVLALAIRHGYTIVEIPLAWTAIPESKVRIFRDGLQMFWCLIRLYMKR